MRNRKRYYLVTGLIKQYDRLHAQSEGEREKANQLAGDPEAFRKQFLKCRNSQTRARWILQVANLLLEKLVEENLAVKVEFT